MSSLHIVSCIHKAPRLMILFLIEKVWVPIRSQWSSEDWEAANSRKTRAWVPSPCRRNTEQLPSTLWVTTCPRLELLRDVILSLKDHADACCPPWAGGWMSPIAVTPSFPPVVGQDRTAESSEVPAMMVASALWLRACSYLPSSKSMFTKHTGLTQVMFSTQTLPGDESKSFLIKQEFYLLTC